MAEDLLNNAINGKIPLESIFEWLSNNKNNPDQPQQKLIDEHGCTLGEFVSNVLNSIHEKAQCIDKLVETPQKVHTPKAIRKLNPTNSAVKKHLALFPELPKTPTNTSPKRNIEPNSTNPVSPLYGNRLTPKDKNSLCLGDFITKRKSSGKKKVIKSDNFESKKTRRINPTNLNQRSFSGSFTNSFNFKEGDSSGFNPPEENLKVVKVINKVEVSPNLSLVSFQPQLDKLVKIYVFCLDSNLVLNVISEIYFVLSLVLNRLFENDVTPFFGAITFDENPFILMKNLFTNVHNSVYFGIKVLETQVHILSLLEKSCIKLLIGNERLKLLSSELVEKLKVVYEEKVEIKLEPPEPPKNVCFISDTDNRENFPTDSSFHAFRKQRDIFYEILHIYQTNHSVDNWNFSQALSGKIKALLTLHADPANLRHFSRLFKSQLLSSCTENPENPLSENSLSFLSSLTNINSEKLNRLKNRLTSRQAPSSGINALPVFVGQQEFYRDFIITAANHELYVHLRDSFINGILQLNDSKFSCNDLEDKDNLVDVETKKSYLICVKSLRILAKFLGFLETIPYGHPTTCANYRLLPIEIESRSWNAPPLPLQEILKASNDSGNLILLIPWLTKLLSMLNPATLRLNYYEKLYDTLFDIFHRGKGGVLVKLCLGWLFELPHFPSEFYYSWCSRMVEISSTQQETGLDKLDIVDKQVLYSCCPYLDEFKKLLQYNSRGTGVTVKHITPVTAVETPNQIGDRRLKLQLEEAFLNAQPISMRKTIEFVSERVASSCVKTICNRLVPTAKQNGLGELREVLQEQLKSLDRTNKRFQADLKGKSDEFMQKKLLELLKACEEETEKQITNKILQTIPLLLSDDDLQQTRDTCSAIAARMCKDRVQQWVNSHINNSVFSKDFDAELQRIFDDKSPRKAKPKSVFTLPTTGRSKEHNEDTLSAVLILELIRDLSIEAVEGYKVSRERVEELLVATRKCVQERCDVNDSVGALIDKCLLDFVLLLIVYRSEICDSNLFLKFVAFWKEHATGCKELFGSILCPRNVKLLGRKSESWSKISTFFSILLREKLLDCESFETQCLSIYQQNWDSDTLRRMSTCLQDVLQSSSSATECNSKFNFLLSFLSDFCCDMDEF